MATQLIWNEHDVLARALGFELASLSFFLNDDTTNKPPASLSLQIVVRVAGVQIGATTVSPLANEEVHVGLLTQIGGTLDGQIDDLRALDATGAQTGWATATGVGFKITAIGDVTVTAEMISRFVPVVGPLLSAALAAKGKKITVALAHQDIVVHLPRTA